MELRKNKLIPLKEIADVRRGFTTGANEFFYLTKEKIRELGIEREFWMHPVTADRWYRIESLIPKGDVWVDKGGEYFKRSQYFKMYDAKDLLVNGDVIWITNYVKKSPKEGRSIIVDPKSLENIVLLIHKDVRELEGTNVLKYIREGERKDIHKRPTLASRRNWYELNEVRGDILCMMSVHDRHIFWLNEADVFIDARLYGISLKSRYRDIKELVLAVLNSTLTFLFVELNGRLNLGLGALDVKVYEYSNMLIVDPMLLKPYKDRIYKILNLMANREIGSVFEEIGAYSPDALESLNSLEKVKSDRRELDKIIMGEILGLTDEEQLEVYRAVIDLVKSRIDKARSVRREKKRKAENNFDRLSETILNDIKKFYESEIVKLKRFPDDYIKDISSYNIIEIPKSFDVKAYYDLFGNAYVQIGDKKIKCKSLDEAKYVAKYIKFAVIAGKSRIIIPADLNKTIEIVEKHAKLVEEIEAKIEEYLKQIIVDKKIRDNIKSRVMKSIGMK